MNIERIKAELSKTYARIEQLQKRARDLEEQKKQAEDMEYLKIIRKHGISAEELQLMIDISNEEQKQILENREKAVSYTHLDVYKRQVCIPGRGRYKRYGDRYYGKYRKCHRKPALSGNRKRRDLL